MNPFGNSVYLVLLVSLILFGAMVASFGFGVLYPELGIAAGGVALVVGILLFRALSTTRFT